ncbi:hypothetical protein BFW01_g1698 [Lasiodiplodia theobromae]|nr:hypothetical protein BFW01_g1698 [Lasiodiplodia theobromae]
MKQVPEIDLEIVRVKESRSATDANAPTRPRPNSSEHAIDVGERDLASTCGNSRYRYHTDDEMVGIESNWPIKHWASDKCGLDGMKPALLLNNPSPRVRRGARTSPPSGFVFGLEHGLLGVRGCVPEGGRALLDDEASWGIAASKGGFLSISPETGEVRSTKVHLDVARHGMSTLGIST